MGRLHPALGLAAAQARAGKTSGCIPGLGLERELAARGREQGPGLATSPGQGSGRARCPRRVEFRPGTAGAGRMRVVLTSWRGEPPHLRQDRPGVEWAPKREGGNGVPAARRQQLSCLKMAEKGVPGHPLPGSSSGEPRHPEHGGRRRQPRLVTGTMRHRQRARCLPVAGAGRGQRRGARGAGGGGGARGEREAGAGQVPPPPPPPGGTSVPFNPFIPARWWQCEPPGREPPARRRGGSALARRRRCRREGAGRRSPAAPPPLRQQPPGTRAPFGPALGGFASFRAPEGFLPSGTAAVPRHPSRAPAASVSRSRGRPLFCPRGNTVRNLSSVRSSPGGARSSPR